MNSAFLSICEFINFMPKDKIVRIPVPFKPEEDEILKQVIAQLGPHNWIVIASKVPGRTVRQCVERWRQLNSSCEEEKEFTRSEDQLLLEKVKELGKKWNKIAMFFEKRSEASLKNRYKVIEKKQDDKKYQKKIVNIVKKDEVPLNLSETDPFDEIFNKIGLDYLCGKNVNDWWNQSSEFLPIF